MHQNNAYKNFVKASETTVPILSKIHYLSGEEAKNIYLKEVSKVNTKVVQQHSSKTAHSRRTNHFAISDKDLFKAAQNNDVNVIKDSLIVRPEIVNIIDEYGWSLLMVACQANSVETVKELLKNGADVDIRDKAGNSARSLVINNKNVALVNLLLNNQSNETIHYRNEQKTTKVKLRESFICEICGNQTYSDKESHLSSTVHNLNASKDRKVTTCFKIPETNKGFQLMLKGGWNKDTGLGRDGQGKIYPIRTKQKLDRKGLGNKERKLKEEIEKTSKKINKEMFNKEYARSRRMEVEFRRQFY